MSGLLKFLKSSKQRLASLLQSAPTHPRHRITLVLGNEAADLDSLVSSLSYAYLLHHKHQHSAGLPLTPLAPRTASVLDPLYVPVVNIPRQDFSLRTDCVYALKHALGSVSASSTALVDDLTFLSDLGLDALERNHDLELVLTDHNRISPQLEKYSKYVTGIIDHHFDDGLYPSASPRTIELVGSATSLVVREWRSYASSLDSEPIDPALAELLLCPILLDTINLDPKFGRVTPVDQQAAESLLQIIGGAKPGTDLQAYASTIFGGLQAAKFSVSDLSSWDLLRKDYKEWVMEGFRVGISSVTWYLEGPGGWIERDGLESVARSLEAFGEDRQLDLLVVMAAFDHASDFADSQQADRGFNRELAVHVPAGQRLSSTSVQSRLFGVLEGSSALGLEPSQHERVLSMRLYSRMDAKYSRKQFQPLLNDMLRDNK
ncbi:uncharacterized protein BJ171DRAFT_520207 [Polychytrium aggregatum]|uniref:uncharacterized protein n=1 Tax=Polychytrium aggregatum TaxID=110093 RepID=UPI0022FE552C|nr:uncharacterized protein BJ171DRAFT_520207 [Polychytrium aggregatum]KAI9197409.1 hypothetical protein BJ171DRAFT_520207 [Polychytrium aggregatum]